MKVGEIDEGAGRDGMWQQKGLWREREAKQGARQGAGQGGRKEGGRREGRIKGVGNRDGWAYIGSDIPDCEELFDVLWAAGVELFNQVCFNWHQMQASLLENLQHHDYQA